MRKRITALLLTLVLVFAMIPASASAAGLDNFQKVHAYSDQFTDVSYGQWYASNVKIAYEYGLVKGTSETKFSPGNHITIAQTITLAARLHSIYHTGTDDFTHTGDKWYSVYVDYALDNQILSGSYSNYNAPATRIGFAEILARALPSTALSAVNTVDAGAIPDLSSDNSAVYMLYRAGILTGSDAKGTFNPNSNIKRSEVATVVIRMADPSLREKFTLKVEPKPMTVYWTPNGEKYHRQTCPTLSRSKTVYSGTVGQAGGRGACKVCKP